MSLSSALIRLLVRLTREPRHPGRRRYRGVACSSYMIAPFSRTLRSIEADGRGRRRWVVFPALAVLAVWCVWMVRAQVPLFAQSNSARLVTDRAMHPLESSIDGRIVSVHAALEQDVQAGAVLIELDSTEHELALVEERARFDAFERQLETTRIAIAALERALTDARAAANAERREIALAVSTQEVSRRLADEEAQRLGTLRETGGVSELALSKARGEAQKAGIAVESQGVALERIELEQRRADSDREAELSERRRDLAESEGARAVAAAAVQRLEHEIERCRLRAPATGRIAELASLSPGRFVRAGERLGALVSPGRLAVEADFAPADALGRVRLGQRGELALAGFPRAQFGSLPVEVERIASEARDGTIRVELDLIDAEHARSPLEHGLPGEVRIEVERTTPAALVLRAVGGALQPVRGALLPVHGKSGG